jgi:RNA polymerase sigma-70 factor (ECF subfamily)
MQAEVRQTGPVEPTNPKDLRASFLAALVGEDLEALGLPTNLESALSRVVSEATTANDDLDVDLTGFVAQLARCCISQRPIAQALDRVHAGDLLLAHGCAVGQKVAIDRFERQVWPAIEPPLRRLGLDACAVDEVRQELRNRLLVAEDQKPPLIAQYTGRGPLVAWVKICAVRLALRQKRIETRASPSSEQAVDSLASSEDDPELALLKERYRAEFAAAFKHAFSVLAPRSINLLRYHYVDGLTTYQIAAIYQVHQVTAARWIERARQGLLRETRRELMGKLGLGRPELESIMRLIQSQLHVSVRQFSGPPEAAEP